jgi:putative membrane protein
MPQGPARADPRFEVETRMSLTRTRLSFERTLMSWVRTSASLITFGFSLAKASGYLKERDAPGGVRGLSGLHEFSVMVVVIGVIALVLATIQQLRHLRRLHALDVELPIMSVGQVVAILFSIVGIWALSVLLM